MIYSIDKQINGKFAIVVLDTDKEGNFIPTVVTDWIHGSFNIMCNGKNVGEIGSYSDLTCIKLLQPNTYIEFVNGSLFPRIHTTAGDLLTFKEIL